MTRPPRPRARVVRGAVAAALGLALAATTVGAPSAAQERRTTGAAAVETARDTAPNPVTPGDFTGYGFDQCLAPDQRAMNTWLTHSPFLAVGIYISGDSRACRSQPNLTPDWVRTQLAKGWRLLPITLGPQASCQPRFPRYDDDYTISPKPGANGRYYKARTMGTEEATKAVRAAEALGIAPGSTLWYDLEGYDNSNRHCRESALSFLSAWTDRLHELGWVSGVYSSAGSGIKALDDARVNRPGAFTLPDMIWIARWDGRADTSTSYIRNDGWRPGGRVKQYQGGHDETWGGVTINIDRNYLDVGRGSVAEPETHCSGVRISYPTYVPLAPATAEQTPPRRQVKALQCLLQEQGVYAGALTGRYKADTVEAVNAWQQARKLPVSSTWSEAAWVSLLSAGTERPVLKVGSAGPAVRRVQRALNAAEDGTALKVSGVYDGATATALRGYQDAVGVEITGIVAGKTWRALQHGRR